MIAGDSPCPSGPTLPYVTFPCRTAPGPQPRPTHPPNPCTLPALCLPGPTSPYLSHTQHTGTPGCCRARACAPSACPSGRRTSHTAHRRGSSHLNDKCIRLSTRGPAPVVTARGQRGDLHPWSRRGVNARTCIHGHRTRAVTEKRGGGSIACRSRCSLGLQGSLLWAPWQWESPPGPGAMGRGPCWGRERWQGPKDGRSQRKAWRRRV